LKVQVEKEKENSHERFDFESVLDECGYGVNEELPAMRGQKKLWEVIFD